MPLKWANCKHLSPSTTAKYPLHKELRPNLKPSLQISPLIFPNVQINVHHPAGFEVKTSTAWMASVCVCVCVCVCVSV